jgi:hypothetical protein
MPTPYVSGNASIATRWLNGSATVLWIGDSIGAAFENRLFQVLRVMPAGICIPGANFSGLATPAWAAAGAGGLGAAGLLTERNYSPFGSREAVFNGNTVPVTGLNIPVNSRLFSDIGEPLLINSRTGVVLGGIDWLAGTTPNLRCIIYRNASSSNGMIRDYVRGSSSIVTARGTGAFLNLASSTPAYLADDVPFIAPAAGEDIYLESQSFEGATPANGSNYVLCCALVTSGRPGFIFVPASNSGWDVLKWLDTTLISSAALLGALPLLGVTDVVFSIGNENPGAQTAAQFQTSLSQLVTRFRNALPTASIAFIPTYDTNNAGSAPHLAGFADAHYAVQQATPNSCFLNLYKAAGAWGQNNALGLFAGGGVNPNDPGKVYFLQTIQGLLETLISGNRTLASGRYANRTDIEDAFGLANVTAWAEMDASGVADLPRIQRALDYADATIDDFFRDGPYGSPLLLGASRATVAAWAAAFAGVRLYRSRTADGGTGGAAPFTASVSISGGSTVSASVGQSADPYSALLANVRQQMARCKAGAFRIDATPITASNAPSIADC